MWLVTFQHTTTLLVWACFHCWACSVLPRGGLPIVRHNEICDITASLLTEVCHDILLEPDLQPLTGEVIPRETSVKSDDASLDIARSRFWGGGFKWTYLDVRIFNPYAPSNRGTSIPNSYRKHEHEKKQAYERRLLEVVHLTFTPLVFFATGGMARKLTIFYRRQASLLADKWDQTYSSTLCWVHSWLSFFLLHSAIQCIRGARCSCGHAIKSPTSIGLVNTGAQLHLSWLV